MKVGDPNNKLDNLECHTRKNNIIVQGISIQENKNPVKLAIKICKAVDVKIDPNEIDAAHRL